MLGSVLLLALVTISVTPPEKEQQEGPNSEGLFENPAPDELRRWEEEVVRSCVRALGWGECVSSSGSGMKLEEWLAMVKFSDESVDVVLRKGERTMERTLEFAPADSQEQRRVAAGLLVAAMTASARLHEVPHEEEKQGGISSPLEANESATLAEESSTLSEPKAEPSESAEAFGFFLDLAISSGPILDAEIWGLGGQVRGVWWVSPRHQHVPWGLTSAIRARHSMGSAISSGDLDVTLGVALSVLSSGLAPSFHVHAEGVASALRVFAVPATEGSQGALRAGAQLGLAMSFGSGRFSPLVGVDARWLAPALELERDGEPLLQVPETTLVLSLGVHIQP